MCTLTVLRAPWRDGWEGEAPRWRMVFNRDERRDRPAARPPETAVHDGVRVVAPVDPVAGGTWIAATSAGLVFALTNDYDGRPGSSVVTAPRSRGLVIPSVLRAASRTAAVRGLEALDARQYLPFRAFVADADAVSEVVWDGRRLRALPEAGGARVMRTSSAVDGARVRAARTALFAQLVSEVSRAGQDAFHAYRRPGDPALGVAMSRADACTVSVTTLDVFAGRVHITYRALTPETVVTVTDLGLAS